MPSILENKQIWNDKYEWIQDGNEWSIPWGGVHMQWHTMLLPRIHKYLSKSNILEIACGHGRWTYFLKDFANNFIGIDLSQNAIDICKKRFEKHKNIKFYTNDGKSLDMVESNSIDFIFSCDSLVHVDINTLDGYLSQLDRILKKDGVAFIHHSNLNEYENCLKQNSDIHMRDKSVDAKKVEICAKKYDLKCITQEKIKWISIDPFYIDCFSVITKKGSIHERKNLVYKNTNFQNEVKNSFLISNLYTFPQNKISNNISYKNILYVLRSLLPLRLKTKDIIERIYLGNDIEFIDKLNNHALKYRNLDFTSQIVNFLENQKIKEIIVYGAGEVFSKLIRLLKNTDIKILHAIDKKAKNGEFNFEGYKVLAIESILDNKTNTPIVITSFSFADEIKKELLEKLKQKNNIRNIIDIKDIL